MFIEKVLSARTVTSNLLEIDIIYLKVRTIEADGHSCEQTISIPKDQAIEFIYFLSEQLNKGRKNNEY